MWIEKLIEPVVFDRATHQLMFEIVWKMAVIIR